MNNIEKIFEAFHGISLSIRERANMRLQLQSHMRENPVPRTWVRKTASRASEFFGSFEKVLNSRTFITHPIFAAFALVLCVGLGTSYAAESSLPGQALYSFKTRVNEPLQGAFATTPTAKAEWSAELTLRRLREAEELAVTDQLSPVAMADIETGLDTAVSRFTTNIKLISETDDVAATNVQSNLEATLNAHEVVLSSLSIKQKKNTNQITAVVQKHVAIVSKDRANFEATLTATDSPKVKAAALMQQKSAKDAIQNAHLLSKDASDTKTASSVDAIALEATNDIDAGEKDAKRGNWGKAYGAFQDALRKMKETQDSVKTRNWLKSNFKIDFDASSTSSATTTGETDDAGVQKGSATSDD